MPSISRRQRAGQTCAHHLGAEDIALVQRWCLELLLHHGGISRFIGSMGYEDDDLALFLGLQPIENEDEDELAAQRQAIRKIKARYAELMRTSQGRTEAPPVLVSNVTRIAGLIGASAVEQKILTFAVLMHAESALNQAACFIGNLTMYRLIRVLAALLHEPEAAVKEALAENSIFSVSGILTVERMRYYDLPEKLELISNGFAERMLESDTIDPISMFRPVFNPALASSLQAGNFEHMREEFDLLRTLMSEATNHRRTGVNVFLYGEPGTGKTEMARLVAQLLNVYAFEVSSEEEDGTPITGEKRLKAWRAANAMLKKNKGMLIFDEVEDVFSGGSLLESSTAQKRKGWVNRALENNPVPTIWLSNDVSSLDPAFVRRFDLVMEVKQPTRSQRRVMSESMVGHLASAEMIERMAVNEHLSPAIIQRAAHVAERLKAHGQGTDMSERNGEAPDTDDMENVLEVLMNNTLKAQGYSKLGGKNASLTRALYEPAFTHADHDLARLAAGIQRNPRARLCLYGPPGTGKTAYGHWLAERMDRPLIVKRASDLLGKCVGESEQKMAQAFERAVDEQAVLLIDEVDSFLQDRRNARQTWEVTMVNEMLTQMESFEGVFIASTNLMDGLDPATLRRFDLKVKFDFLKSEQAQALYIRWCSVLGLDDVQQETLNRIAALNVLAPGDFSALGRAHRFQPFENAEELAAALEQECSLKNIGRKIGF